MSDIHQGMHIKTISTDDGREVNLRYPSWGDEEGMRDFINSVSAEDTFITFSGETVNPEDEHVYLTRMFSGMDEEDTILIIAVVKDQVVGSVSIERKTDGRRRSRHVSVFGISIRAEYRGIGLGEAMARTAIDEAGKRLPELKMITLSVYSLNERAHNLYVKLGFKEYGRLPGGVWYRDQYIDEILMYRELGSAY